MFQIWILVELDHFLNDLVVVAVKVCVIVVDLGVVSGLLSDPVLLLLIELSLELAIVFEDSALVGIIITVTNIVSSLRNFLGATNVIGDQSEAVRAQTLQLFCVEAAIFNGAVIPLLLSRNIISFSSELEVIVKEVLSIDQLPTIPLGYVATSIRINQGSISVEFSLVKVSLVDDLIWECELSETLIPALLHGALVLTSTPL